MKTIRILDTDLEFVRLVSAHPRPGAPAIVFLHEGLGSISMWRDFPQKVADATGCEAVVYSRYGYGRSTPRRGEPNTPRYMHVQALEVLPALLDALELERPFLLGHSDGGSIALLHAAAFPERVAALVVAAPHLFVEALSLASIADARTAYATTDLRQRLARHHDDPDSAFRGWNDIWLDPAFRDWNIEAEVATVRCPVLAVQGVEDPYGTMAQIDRIADLCPGRTELLKLPQCGHSPHRDQSEALIAGAVDFLHRIA